jgi:hypothetical protein
VSALLPPSDIHQDTSRCPSPLEVSNCCTSPTRCSTPLHLEHPEWIPVFDILPEQASVSKHRIFNLAAEEDALVFAHHFPPFPNLGHIRKQEQGWRWQPIERQG